MIYFSFRILVYNTSVFINHMKWNKSINGITALLLSYILIFIPFLSKQSLFWLLIMPKCSLKLLNIKKNKTDALFIWYHTHHILTLWLMFFYITGRIIIPDVSQGDFCHQILLNTFFYLSIYGLMFFIYLNLYPTKDNLLFATNLD